MTHGMTQPLTGDPFLRSLLPLLQWGFYLVALVVGATVYRLTALNTFVDHRKTVLRNHLAKEIGEHSELLTVIQNVGKVGVLRDAEQQLFEMLSPGCRDLVRQIYKYRKAYALLAGQALVLVGIVTVLLTVLALDFNRFAHFPRWWFAIVVVVFIYSLALIAINIGLDIVTSPESSDASLLHRLIKTFSEDLKAKL
jgi:hypothetical protein